MPKENNKVDINKHEIDIDNLKKQNVNDFLSIKELYRKFKEIEEKISQIKYIDSKLADKLKKDYEGLKKIILDENVQIQLKDKIDETKTLLQGNINVIENRLDTFINNVTYINLNDFKHLVVGDDWTNALQEAINTINPGSSSSDSHAQGQGVIELPSGVIGIKSVVLKSRVTIRGQGMYRTRIKPLLNDGSTMFSQTGCNWSKGNLMTNVSIEDLSITPNGRMWSDETEKVNVNVFDFTTNLNLYCKNIAIDNINGCCFDLRTCMDSYLDNIWITFCGDNDFAMKLGTLNGDLTNAITFNMVHIENCPKMITINDGSRQNKFISCKFESTVGRGITPTDSPIQLNSSLSNVFDSCIFATTLEDCSFIKVNNGSACDLFNACTFATGVRDKGWIFNLNNPMNLIINGCTCGEYGVGKFITNAINTIISNCSFFRCGLDNVFMQLKTNNILKNNIFSNVNTNNFIITIHENNTISDNNFINSKNQHELINITGGENVIKGCRYTKQSGNATKFMNVVEEVSGNIIDKNFFKEADIVFNGATRRWNYYNESYSNTINEIGIQTTGSLKNVGGFIQFYDGTGFVNIPKQTGTAKSSSASDVATLRTDLNNLIVQLVNAKVLK